VLVDVVVEVEVVEVEVVVDVDVVVDEVVEVDVVVDVEVVVEVEVVVVDCITIVFVARALFPEASTMFPVNRTVPIALASVGNVKLTELVVSAFDTINEKMMFEVTVFFTK
jgi:hypothetical protein